jgi:hypothetical protein
MFLATGSGDLATAMTTALNSGKSSEALSNFFCLCQEFRADAASTRKATLQHHTIKRKSINTRYDAFIFATESSWGMLSFASEDSETFIGMTGIDGLETCLRLSLAV